jgi:uncharacterized protein
LVRVEFDSDKNEVNRCKHGIPLAAAAQLDFDAALVVADERRDWREPRFRAFGPIGGRLHVLAFTMRGGALRAISLRKANAREKRRYEQRER